MNSPKSNAADALTRLKEGNARFVAGKAEHPNANSARMTLAASKNQADFAYATILSCSDSRVPVELIFDAGIMELFVIRVAGNVCLPAEIGTIEYGLAHVKTPLLVVLGHTQCGAIRTAIQSYLGPPFGFEKNIPHILRAIQPAVEQALEDVKSSDPGIVLPKAIEQNVWHNIEHLFLNSPVVRTFAHCGQVKLVGAIYDVGTGKVNWLSDEKISDILEKADSSMNRKIDPGVIYPQ
jgi:carbonic anhydrase